MNTTNPISPADGATSPRGRATGLGVLLIADGLLALAPVAILGAAIGWPASLDAPRPSSSRASTPTPAP